MGLQLVKQLLAQCTQADLEYSNWNGSTALHQAAHVGNLEMVCDILTSCIHTYIHIYVHTFTVPYLDTLSCLPPCLLARQLFW